MRTKKPFYGGIGSVSSGTMREQDLIPSFLWEAKHLRLTRAERKEVTQINSRVNRAESAEIGQGLNYRNTNGDVCGYWESETSSFDLEELFNILDAHSLPYFSFGSHPGDGADYGWWLPEGFDEDFDGLKVSDTSEVPKGYTGEVLHVNDHGNVSLYSYSRGRSKEIWAVV
jgi:hypothetical protein